MKVENKGTSHAVNGEANYCAREEVTLVNLLNKCGTNCTLQSIPLEVLTFTKNNANETLHSSVCDNTCPNNASLDILLMVIISLRERL